MQEEVFEEIEENENLDIIADAKNVSRIKKSYFTTLKAKNENKDTLNIIVNTGLDSKNNLKLNNVYQNLLYKNRRINYIGNALKKELNLESSGQNQDFRSLTNMALLQGARKKDLFLKEVDKIDDEDIDLVLSFSKYPKIDDLHKNNFKYVTYQTKEIKPYMDQFNDFMSNDFMNTLKKYDYKIDFKKMNEEEIYNVIAASILTQDYFVKNTQEYVSYFDKKFNTYEKRQQFETIGQILNTINVVIFHECAKYNMDMKPFECHDALALRDPDEVIYDLKSVENTVNFYVKDRTKIDFYLGDLLDLDDDTLVSNNDLLNQGLMRIYPYGDISNSIYSSGIYNSVYVDGKSIEEIVREDKNINFDELEPYERKKVLVKTFATAIKSADKIIEYAFISEAKDTYTVEVIPVVFDYKEQNLKEKYQATLTESKTNEKQRHDNIINTTKKLVKNFVKHEIKPYENYTYVSKEQREIDKYNDFIDELVYEYDDKKISSYEFNGLYQKVLQDFNNKNHILDYIDEIKDSIDDSSMFMNRDILKHFYKNVHETYDLGACLLKYVAKNPNLKVEEPINRDMLRYFMALSNVSSEQRVLKTLEYVLSVQKRDKDLDNRDYSLSRKLCAELISNFLDTKVDLDMSKESNVANMYQHVNQAFMIGQFFDSDKAYKEFIKNNNPKLYYKLSEERSLYETLYANTKDEIKALTGFKNINDKSGDGTLVSYSRGCDTLFSDNINVSRNKASLTKLYLEHNYSDKKSINLDIDVSVYGLFGNHNDLVYEELESDDISRFIEGIENFKNVDISMLSSDNLPNINKYALSSINVREMFLEFESQLKAENELLNDVLLKDKYKDYLFNSFAINGTTLNDLVSDYKRNPAHSEISNEDIAAAYFAKALNNPKDVITHTTIKFVGNNVKTDTVVVNKNYSAMAERCKDSHTKVEKFFHFIKLYTYDEEKKIKTQKNSVLTFEKNNNIKTINDNFYDKYKMQIDLFNIKLQNKLEKQPLEVKEIVNEIKQNKVLLNDNAKIVNNTINDINNENKIGK